MSEPKKSGWIVLKSKKDIPLVTKALEQQFPGIEVKDSSNNGIAMLSVSGKGAEDFYAVVGKIAKVV